MWVIKIGGSLYGAPELANWLDAIAPHGTERVVIVPGGGPFADQLRVAQVLEGFDNVRAHHMALRAMEQFGRVLIALEPRLTPACSMAQVRAAWATGCVPVWFPARTIARQAELEASWNVTSDSLAAWLAARLGAAHLALTKSVDPSPGRHDAAALAARGIVDTSFPRFIENSRFRTWWFGRQGFRILSDCLDGTAPAAEIVAIRAKNADARDPVVGIARRKPRQAIRHRGALAP